MGLREVFILEDSFSSKYKWWHVSSHHPELKALVILTFSCRFVLTNTAFDTVASTVVLLRISKRLTFHLRYPFALIGNHVFSADQLYSIGMLLVFQGSLWEALHCFSSVIKM